MFTTTLLLVAFAGIPYPSNLTLTGRVAATYGPGDWSGHPDSDAPRAGDTIYSEIMCYPWGHCQGWMTVGRLQCDIVLNPDTEVFGPSRTMAGFKIDGSYPWPEEPSQLWRVLYPGYPTMPYGYDPVRWPMDQEIRVADLQLATHKLGDSNLDGRFSSRDIITAFRAGEYEDGVFQNSTFVEGDWNADREFDSADFIAVFKSLTYEQPAVAVVPEPSAVVLLLLGMLSLRHRAKAACS